MSNPEQPSRGHTSSGARSSDDEDLENPYTDLKASGPRSFHLGQAMAQDSGPGYFKQYIALPTQETPARAGKAAPSDSQEILASLRAIDLRLSNLERLVTELHTSIQELKRYTPKVMTQHPTGHFGFTGNFPDKA